MTDDIEVDAAHILDAAEQNVLAEVVREERLQQRLTRHPGPLDILRTGAVIRDALALHAGVIRQILSGN